MNTLTTLRPITRALIRPTSICSQFIRLNGHLGWLTAPLNPCADGYEFRKTFGISILPWSDDLFDAAEATTAADLADFYESKRFIKSELVSMYSGNNYTGD